MKIDFEREYLVDEMLANEVRWNEEEAFYEKERNKRLPAIIKVMIPHLNKIKK